MAIGSIFAAMNTMYAAVAYRGREIATLRVIDSRQPALLTHSCSNHCCLLCLARGRESY